MKKNKSAFTLMETLIALAIVGVLATIITPAVTNQMKKNETGMLLSRAITQIETGCQNIVQLANSNVTGASYHEVLSTITTRDLGFDNSANIVLLNLETVASGFWGLEPVSQAIAYASIPMIQSYNGGDAGSDATNISSGTLLQSTKGNIGVCIIQPANIATLQDITDENTGAMVYVDTNGWMNMPNKIGKDIFGFSLLNGGKLVPLENSDAGDYAEQIIDAGFKVTY